MWYQGSVVSLELGKPKVKSNVSHGNSLGVFGETTSQDCYGEDKREGRPLCKLPWATEQKAEYKANNKIGI